MIDNFTIDRLGRILIQEDVGGNDRLGKICLYDIGSSQLIEVAAHNPMFFSPGMPAFLMNDEESSGIIDARRILGKGWFLLDVQAHVVNPDLTLVEGGQLLAMFVDVSIGSGSDDGDDDEDDEAEDSQ